MSDKHEQFRQLMSDLADVNTDRGGGSQKGLKGFYAEYINSTYGNLDKIDKGAAAREKVINDNGDWDAITKYATGNLGRPIQDKVGYTFSYYKNKISSNQYDNGILRINPDNPIFSDDKKLAQLKRDAKAHGIKIVKGNVTEKEVKKLAVIAGEEGKIRATLGMEKKAPITTKLYVGSKEIAYSVEKLQEKVTEVNDYIQSTTTKFLSENLANINRAGLSQAESAACFAAAMSIGRNAISLIKGGESLNQSVKNVIKDTSTTAVIGFATGALSEIAGVSIGDASFLINGTIQISKQLIACVDGDIDGEKLVENIVEISVQLTSAYMGRMIGGAIGSVGGPLGIVAGQFIGEMISTAVCANLISAIKFSREFKKQNKKIISLYRNAEYEIRASQARLEVLIQKDNEELKKAISVGMDTIAYGIMNGTYDEIELGLANISEKFDLSLELLQKDKITKDNLLNESANVIVFE